MNIQLGFSIPEFEPFSPQAANVVGQLGQTVYALSGYDTNTLVSLLSAQDPAQAIAAYMILTGYEQPNLDFACSFQAEIDAAGLTDSTGVYSYIKDKYLAQPKFLENQANTLSRLKNKLDSATTTGVDLFVLRAIQVLSGNAPAVTLNRALKRKSACVQTSDTGLFVLKIFAMGILGFVGYKALRTIFK